MNDHLHEIETVEMINVADHQIEDVLQLIDDGADLAPIIHASHVLIQGISNISA